MMILLPALAVAFAAFCIWLTVRIINRRERWAKWTLAVIMVGSPVLYALSIGPAAWLVSKRRLPASSLAVYWPLVSIAEYSEITSTLMVHYVDFWAGAHPERIDDSIPMRIDDPIME